MTQHITGCSLFYRSELEPAHVPPQALRIKIQSWQRVAICGEANWTPRTLAWLLKMGVTPQTACKPISGHAPNKVAYHRTRAYAPHLSDHSPALLVLTRSAAPTYLVRVRGLPA